jgi:hypothetical protein
VPPSRKLIVGSAGAAALGVRVARSLHARWRALPRRQRAELAPFADAAKEQALDSRGAPDYAEAAAKLRAANESLAAALIRTAESDPDVTSTEVAELKGDLRRELERLADAEVKASRSSFSTPPQG